MLFIPQIHQVLAETSALQEHISGVHYLEKQIYVH